MITSSGTWTSTRDDRRDGRRILTAGVVLGAGLGGFVDGIVLHQILQWHHMLTARAGTELRSGSVAALEENTLADGLFHAGTWVLVATGLLLLWRTVGSCRRWPGRALVGPLLLGWGLFNLVEGVVNHHVLELHHVRDDVAEPLWWDLGFLALGGVLVAAGLALHRAASPAARRLDPPHD